MWTLETSWKLRVTKAYVGPAGNGWKDHSRTGLAGPSQGRSKRDFGQSVSARAPLTHGRFHHFSDSGTAFCGLRFGGGTALRGSGAAFGGETALSGPLSAGGVAEARADSAASCSRWAAISRNRSMFSFSNASLASFVRTLYRTLRAVASRKITARAQPALNRKRLRYKHPPSTHSRCIGRMEGSATGRGKSGSSGLTASTSGCRSENVFIRVSPESPSSSSPTVGLVDDGRD